MNDKQRAEKCGGTAGHSPRRVWRYCVEILQAARESSVLECTGRLPVHCWRHGREAVMRREEMKEERHAYIRG